MRLVGRVIWPMYLANLRMRFGCRSGLAPSVDVRENHSTGRSVEAMSAGRASSASKISSIRDVSFSRGA